MLKALANGLARLLGAPMPTERDGAPVDPDVYREQWVRDEERKIRLDEELLFKTHYWEDEDRG